MSDTGLRQRIGLKTATKVWLNASAAQYHYMHRPVHDRACPFGWRVTLDGKATATDGAPYGFIIFCSVHFVRLKLEWGYPGLPTKWQVLSLARLWLHDDMPKLSATCVIGKAHKLVQRRWLEVHPPVNYAEPYHILKIVSYADMEFHTGTVYEAANYRYSGETVSKRRHRNTRGPGMDGHKLARYIYDLPCPKWTLTPPPVQLPLFEVAI